MTTAHLNSCLGQSRSQGYSVWSHLFLVGCKIYYGSWPLAFHIIKHFSYIFTNISQDFWSYNPETKRDFSNTMLGLCPLYPFGMKSCKLHLNWNVTNALKGGDDGWISCHLHPCYARNTCFYCTTHVSLIKLQTESSFDMCLRFQTGNSVLSSIIPGRCHIGLISWGQWIYQNFYSIQRKNKMYTKHVLTSSFTSTEPTIWDKGLKKRYRATVLTLILCSVTLIPLCH